MKIVHTRACRELLVRWWDQPLESARSQMATEFYRTPDIEIQARLLTILDEDPADSEAVTAARELMPLLLVAEPLYAPEDLLSEIDSLAADIERARSRAEMLAAKYRALEPWSELWNREETEGAAAESGRFNVEDTARKLQQVQAWMGDEYLREQLADARKSAEKIRDYDDTTEEQL